MTTKIAFIGLGIMGLGMAHRLIDAGFSVTVYNRTASRADELRVKGAIVAATPRDAAAGAQIVISMLADDQASRAAWLGNDGALAAINPGTLLIECGTLTVNWVRELGETAVAKQCELIDAPVTGSKPQAAAGQLLFLVGGSAEAFARAQPVFSAMGRSAIHLGALGSGATMKLINNFLCGTQLVALAEAITFIERSGLDSAKAMSILLEGAPASPFVKTMSGRISAGDYTPNFLLRLLAKDMTYAIAEARDTGLNLTTAATALQRMQGAIEAGDGERDLSVVVESIRKQTVIPKGAEAT